MEDIIESQERELEALKAKQMTDLTAIKTYSASNQYNWSVGANQSGTIIATFRADNPNAEYIFGELKSSAGQTSGGGNITITNWTEPQVGNGTWTVRLTYNTGDPASANLVFNVWYVGNFSGSISFTRS